MTRRDFFRNMGLLAITPSVVPAVAEKCASIKRWWVPTIAWETEFDFGNAWGYCMEFKNVLTGELARNAVRLQGPGKVMNWSYAEARKIARTLLGSGPKSYLLLWA